MALCRRRWWQGNWAKYSLPPRRTGMWEVGGGLPVGPAAAASAAAAAAAAASAAITPAAAVGGLGMVTVLCY